MLKRATASCLILAVVSSTVPIFRSQSDDASKAAEVKAVEFLKREVPAWSRNNGCFSCHNNGDAARALYRASQQGYQFSVHILTDTTAWLAQPLLWDKNEGDPRSSDERLANLQFALALLTALQTGHVIDKKPLQVAARRVAAGQDPSGAWLIDSGTAAGSPATYGSTLATVMACRVLSESGSDQHKKALESAESWLRRTPLNSVSAAAALLLAGDVRSEAKSRRSDCLAIIERAQTQDGGWGPYVDSPPEVFDTAIVLLALAPEKNAGIAGRIHRARTFLAKQQDADGAWPATTRPAGGESYAQRLSTTGWATLALLATRE